VSDQSEWYKDAVIYQVHVKAYHDSDGDGIGDFPGLTAKLDYLQDLGVTTLWMLPFYPSPQRDDGYDIAGYDAVHPMYGSLRDFRTLLTEAHRRGLRVVTELVINHTSDQHPWFQRARRAKRGTAARDFYVWSDTVERYTDARIIFKDFERSNWTWDHEAGAYYWHRFYSHQPDLNFDSPDVHKAVLGALDFWFNLGVDGLRLDAIPYLYEREGTNCENLPETHAFLKKLRAHVDAKYENRMLLAEANQWPEDAVAYFGDGDECHMSFHFPVMPRLFMSVQMEDRFPIIDILQQTPPIPPSCQWATFLRNHDELTLEMVTDEDRDYMYRVYANDPQARINLGIRRRLAPLMGNNRRRIELLNGLLFSLPGTPIVYYGDEIGMGDNIYLGDRNGVRTPMQWSADRNAGFSRGNPQRLYMPVIADPEFHYEAVNVEIQQNNPASLLWWMKRLIALRKQHRAFGRGTLEFLHPENHRVLSFVRQWEGETILVIANLSRFAQSVELDLARFQGLSPVEMFGRTAFPPIGQLPYFVTVGPYAFYWFSLERQKSEASREMAGTRPTLAYDESWLELLEEDRRAELEAILPAYLVEQRWFRSKAARITGAAIVDILPFAHAKGESRLCLVEVRYLDADAERYLLPLSYTEGRRAQDLIAYDSAAVVASLTRTGGPRADRARVLYDGLWDAGLAAALLDGVGKRRKWRGETGELVATRTRAFKDLRGDPAHPLGATVLKGEQSNTNLVLGDRFLMKLIRKVEPGENPELEIGRYLTEHTRFRRMPLLAGAIEYHRGREAPATLAVLHQFVPSESDAWSFTLDAIQRTYEQVLTEGPAEPAPVPDGLLIELAASPLPPDAESAIGAYLERARLLGFRTAELHRALAAGTAPEFAPEPFTPLYRRSLYQALRSQTRLTMELLRKRIPRLPEELRPKARQVLQREQALLDRARGVLDRRISGFRIRVHGDYHLGQVLFTGRDFLIVDFEGEPSRSLNERRFKRSALRDVAGMLRSFEYAAVHAARLGPVRPEDEPVLRPWGRYWTRWVSVAFLQGYLPEAEKGGFLSKTREEMSALLGYYLVEKAVYELRYELNNRPDWVGIPLESILEHIP
jgi:maltose alpha-D-glucosyltransferase/alpha-amylase